MAPAFSQLNPVFVGVEILKVHGGIGFCFSFQEMKG